MFLKILFTIIFLLAPATLYAWGPLTHVYLGTEIFYFASMLPAGLYSLLKKHKNDFIYGNIMADTILAKKYMPITTHSHNWNAALNLQNSAQTDSELAFAMGYSAHLAADTVAHGDFTAGAKNMKHAMMEARVDRSVGSKYWLGALSISPSVQRRNDIFLESVSPEKVFFSHGTNRRIFKSIVALSGLNSKLMPSKSTPTNLFDCNVDTLLVESRQRILDVMNKGYSSEVLGMDPIAHIETSPILKRLAG